VNRTTHSKLDEYRSADLTKRLYFYLQYRELRPEFAQIERKESVHRQLKGEPWPDRIQMVCKALTWPFFRLVPGLRKWQ